MSARRSRGERLLRRLLRRIVPLASLAAVAVAPAGWAQGSPTGVVVGVVTDRATQQPLPGTQVQVGTTTLGAVSDERGQYLIRGVPVGAQPMRAMRIGYAPQRATAPVRAGDTVRVNFTMSATAVELSTVVVTGTGGAIEKRQLGSSVGTLDVARVQEIVPINTVTQALQGRIPGVRSVSVGGGVGAAKDLRIRGTSSFTLGQRPVVYIDGVKVDTRGTDWSAGLGGQACCNFNGGTGEDRLSDVNPDDIDRVEVLKGAAAATLYGSEATNGVIQIFTKKGRLEGRPSWALGLTTGFQRQRGNYPTHLYPKFVGPDGTRALDLNQTLIGNGPYQGYELAVNGGGQRATYYVSGAFSREEGSLQPNDETKGSFRATTTWSPTDKLSFEARSFFARNKINTLQSGNNWTALTGNASNGDPRGATQRRPYGEAWVPVKDIQQMISIDDANRYTAGLTVNYVSTRGISSRLTLGLDATNEQKLRFFPFEGDFGPAGVNQGEKDLGFRDYHVFTADYLTRATFKLPFGIASDFAVGGAGYFETQRLNMAIGKTFALPGVNTVTSGSTTAGREDYVRTVNLGVLAQNRFSYADRLFTTVGLRVDGNSAFGKDYGFQKYPKFDVAYNVTPARFLPDLVSSLKLRSAIGTAGKAPGAFDQYRTYEPEAVFTNSPAVTPSNPGNTQLAPEKTTEYEAGIEMGLFGDRFGLDASVFRSETKNAIVNAPLAPSQGFRRAQKQNIGSIRNRGWEVSVTWLAISLPDVDWRHELRLDGVRNTVTDLGGVKLSGNAIRVGYPVQGVWARVPTGYAVVNGKPTFTRSDTAVYFGPPLPTLNLSYSPTLRLGPVQLYGLVTMERGAYFSNGDRPYRVRQKAGDEFLATLDNDGKATFATDSLVAYWTLFDDIEKRNNVRLRELSLAYALPAGLTGRIGLGRSTLTLSAQNIHWWDRCHCVDPNMNWAGADSFGQGSGFLADPAPRVFRASFRTRF